MGQRYYWHNISKNIYNENDLGDFVDECEKGDVIKFTDRGSAIIYDLETLKEDQFNEYQYVKDNFLEKFKEVNQIDFFELKNARS